MKTLFERMAEKANSDADKTVLDWNVPMGTPTVGYGIVTGALKHAREVMMDEDRSTARIDEALTEIASGAPLVHEWRRIPSEVDTATTPFDGEDVLLYADSATVDIVRLGFWRDGKELEGMGDWTADDTGWWSYCHSVTQEKLDFLTITHWAPFKAPTDG